MRNYSFKDLAQEVLQFTGRPMNSEQIIQVAKDRGLMEKVGSRGQTPARTVGARIYTDIKDNPNSVFIQISKYPVLFGLKAFHYQENDIHNAQEQADDGFDGEVSNERHLVNSRLRQIRRTESVWKEVALPPLLVTYLRSDPHFRCKAKTINAQKSVKSGKNVDRWVHPDMVGVYFPFDDFDDSTINLQKTLRVNPFQLFSFELKRELKSSNLREYYFQSVSNSSWANEGYLVAPIISSESSFLEDLQRLTNSFGIGVIELDLENPEQSQILFPAKNRNDLDWAVIDRLTSINPDFREFIEAIHDTATVQKIIGDFDDVLDAEALLRYQEKHKLV